MGSERLRSCRSGSTFLSRSLLGVLLGVPLAGALCYELLEITGFGRSVSGAAAKASVLGVSVMLLVSLAACTVPTLRALSIAPADALRAER
jgi:ABC-type lipoprotein release transport system permease subunit